MPHRTKPLPPGTRNTSINAPARWLQIVSKEAYARGLSLGEYFKQHVEQGLAYENPLLANQLRQMRTTMGKMALAGLMAFSVASQWFTNHRNDIAKPMKVRVAKKVTKRTSDDESEWGVFEFAV